LNPCFHGNAGGCASEGAANESRGQTTMVHKLGSNITDIPLFGQLAERLVFSAPPLLEFQRRLGPGVNMQFVVNASNMEPDPVQADAQLVADLLVSVAESELLQNFHFARCEVLHLRPHRVAFTEAMVDIENNRSMEKARALLEEYLHASLTPDDPPRQEAEKLLRRAGGSKE